MKIFNFDAEKKARARAQALRMMRAALVLAVAIVSGCLIVAFLGETIIAIGFWLLHLAVVLAIGFAIGSIAYTLATKLVETVWKPAVIVDMPF